jgi:hypothetical protein
MQHLEKIKKEQIAKIEEAFEIAESKFTYNNNDLQKNKKILAKEI